MTAFKIAMAGFLAFGQSTGNYYEAITMHSGLQVIHADGAVTLRLREETQNGAVLESCTIYGKDSTKINALPIRRGRQFKLRVVSTGGAKLYSFWVGSIEKEEPCVCFAVIPGFRERNPICPSSGPI